MAERMTTAQKNIRERLGGYGGKERVFDPFFSPITVLRDFINDRRRFDKKHN